MKEKGGQVVEMRRRGEAYSVADQNTCPVPRVAPNWRAGSWVDSKRHSRIGIEGVDGALNRNVVTVSEGWGTLYPAHPRLEVGGGQGCREDSSGGEES